MEPDELNASTWERWDDLRTLFLSLSQQCPDYPSDRRIRLLFVAALREVWQHLNEPRSRRAVEVNERHADAPDHRALDAARELALDAYSDVADSADGDNPGFLLAHDLTLKAWESLHPDLRPDSGGPFWVRLFASSWDTIPGRTREETQAVHLRMFKDIFPNPFRPVAFDPSWRTATAIGLARTMYDSRDFTAMPILADALEEAGCDSTEVLAHCRGDGPHVRGCWVVDLVLGKA